jgi:hypothetical protein
MDRMLPTIARKQWPGFFPMPKAEKMELRFAQPDFPKFRSSFLLQISV